MERTELSIEIPTAIRSFFAGIETGDWEGIEQRLAEDVLYDASVPGWHYQYQGAGRVAREYREEWTGQHTWRIVEHHMSPTADGVVVDFEARGRCPGDENHEAHEEAVRIANIFRLADGRILEHRFYCCGEWDEQTLRRIEAEAPRVEGRG
jgi:ketosteroid isomerase-like protein